MKLKSKKKLRTPKTKSTNDQITSTTVVECKLDHDTPGNFRITDESWEVSKVRCHGGCNKDFETEPCNSKNQA